MGCLGGYIERLVVFFIFISGVFLFVIYVVFFFWNLGYFREEREECKVFLLVNGFVFRLRVEILVKDLSLININKIIITIIRVSLGYLEIMLLKMILF